MSETSIFLIISCAAGLFLFGMGIAFDILDRWKEEDEEFIEASKERSHQR